MSKADQPTVRRAHGGDIPEISRINTATFLGNSGDLPAATSWVNCWFQAYPLYQYFVIEREGKVAGYIGWQVHGGFKRPEPVIELEQVALDEISRGQGIGPQLIEESLREVVRWVHETNRRIESHITIVVWGYAFNFNAMKAYAHLFTEVTGLRQMYGDRSETMMRARVPWIREAKT